MAKDLAEYVRITGDEVGVISFFMELVENNKVKQIQLNDRVGHLRLLQIYTLVNLTSNFVWYQVPNYKP